MKTKNLTITKALALLSLSLSVHLCSEARFKNIATDDYEYHHQRVIEQLEKAMRHARDSHARNSEISDINKHLLKAKKYAEEAQRAYQDALSRNRHQKLDS